MFQLRQYLTFEVGLPEAQKGSTTSSISAHRQRSQGGGEEAGSGTGNSSRSGSKPECVWNLGDGGAVDGISNWRYRERSGCGDTFGTHWLHKSNREYGEDYADDN